jgi:solute:Na+ symporter, SSS family
MPLHALDWIVIVGYLLINLAIGIYYRRRAGGNTEDFFVSGRNVSWWLAGTSMVATTFAADTPLFVTGVVATQGISGNWIWWSFCLGGMMTVFFFARYWRRAEILTDVELTEIRYSGKPAAFLRGFKAIYLGLLMNCLILGWVTNAMVSIIAVLLGPVIAQGRVVQLTLGSHTLFQTTLGEPSHTALLICIFVLIPFTGIYTAIGGLWGVLVTDLFQFILKMGMVIILAWVAVVKIGGMHALKLQLQVIGQAAKNSGAQPSNPLAFFPDFHLGWATGALWTLPVLTFVTYVGLQWWSAWYPGAEPGGGGYVAQRMFSAKDEKNSLGATLWFNIAHYAVRPWPWIITALVALAVYSPHGLHPSAAYQQTPQQGYVMVLRDYLPAGLRGVMVAAFLAAFMSTMGTQLNWGVSYLVNDFYRRFLVREKNERHYVHAGRVFTIVLVLVSGYVAGQLTSIGQGWQIVLNLGVGTGAVYILRWYWWRINAWSEIVAMIVAAAVALLLNRLLPGGSPVVFAKTMLITAGCTTAAWLIATFLTPAEPQEKLLSFYRRVHPSVYGWGPIAKLAPELAQVRDFGGNARNWFMGCVLVYCALFGIGKLVFQDWLPGVLLLVIAAIAGYAIFWDLARRGWESLSGRQAPGQLAPDESTRARGTLVN